MVSGFWFLVSGFIIRVLRNLRNLRMHLVSFKTTDPQITPIYADEAEDQIGNQKPKARTTNQKPGTRNQFCGGVLLACRGGFEVPFGWL